ncbi:MAG TPA: sialidase family protein [Chthoniobacterales bacterium]|nr:sialidase family protein [Chthoniobacterales bacterium]
MKTRFLCCGLASLLAIFCLTSKGAPVPGAAINSAVDRSNWPAALQQVPLRRLSSGALMLLDRDGDLVRPPTVSATTKKETEAATAVTLDLRVAPALRLGNDPPALPPSMRAQAEPHIARSQVDPDNLVAIFQEGRFTDAGAVDCGYSVTNDGGLSWTRALIPKLTTTSGGPYPRATDPVAGIDLSGRIFLCTDVATNSDFTQGAIVVSRSTDDGATFAAPSLVFQASSSSDFSDKPWMAVNTFSGAPNSGRVLVTWTEFGSTSASPIYRAYSDDHGVSWSAAAAIHNPGTMAQGSQPVFLHDGRVAIVYWNFADSGFSGDDAALTASPEEIDVVVSQDGGVTFGAPIRVTTVTRYDQPSIRNGTFLPSATVDRTTNDLYVVYQALDYAGVPRVLFTKSTNAGATWSTPIAVTNNPDTGVFNAAIAASPDGTRLTVSFYDQRDNPPGNTTDCNLYLAQSFDGGTTWQPNIRLTSQTTDSTLAPLTSEGYMLGDYLGIAETTSVDVPAVPVWVDTRTGNPDPFITRVGIAPEVTFTAFQASRLSLAQINNPKLGGLEGDADGDGEDNLSEFLSQTEPNDPTSVLHPARQLNISTRGEVESGQNILIGGFIITGTAPKSLIVRALGPSLGAYGVTNTLADPTLELHNAAGDVIATNNDWRDMQETEIEKSGFAPADNREAAIIATLDPGSYTAVVRGQNGGTGDAIVEVYDLAPTAASEFGNISTRGLVGTDQDVLIGGFIIGKNAAGVANVIVRAIGPSLSTSKITDPLPDPTLELHDANGSLIAFDDDWQDTQGAIISSAQLAPPNARESAIFATLASGDYTAVVRGKNRATGVGVVEVFNIP